MKESFRITIIEVIILILIASCNGIKDTAVTSTITDVNTIKPTASTIPSIPDLSPTQTVLETQPGVATKFASPTNMIKLVTPQNQTNLQIEWATVTNANYIRTLYVDRTGILWAGGRGGATRWDPQSKSYEKFTIESGLASNNITAIAEDNNGIMWFGTGGGGISSFNGSEWTTYTMSDGLVDNDVRSLDVSGSGIIWIGTARGISSYDGSEWLTFSSEIDNAPISRSDVITITADDIVWSGSYQGGLAYYKNLRWVSDDGFNSLSNYAPVVAISTTIDGNLWVATNRKVYQNNSDSWIEYDPLKGDIQSQEISSLEVDNQGEVWVGVSANKTELLVNRDLMPPVFDNLKGVYHLKNGHWEIVSTQQGLVSNEITAIIAYENNIWFGSYSNGISLFDGTRWESFRTNDVLLSNWIGRLQIANDGTLWSGHPFGLSSYDGKKWSGFTFTDYLGPSRINTFYIDPNGSKWLGLDKGVFHIEDESVTLYSNEEYEWLKDVYTIGLLPNNSHIFSIRNGASIFDGENWRKINLGVDFSVIEIHPDGQILYGTFGHGLYWDNGSQINQIIQYELGDSSVTSIKYDAYGILWVGTCKGIARFDGDQWYQYDFHIQLPGVEGCITSITSDERDSAWITSEEDILYFNGSTWSYLISANRITSSVLWLNNSLWVATSNGILYTKNP